ncbi:MAG: hypothetical protein LBO00_01185, partial [Zoogloeaceae bacterium]|nr:hypothetical protein [Zoogloeaceae bacterium]
MKTSSHVLKFSTPAFLGNAEWKGVWRTPPIKALLRQWWRVAYAAQAGFFVDISAMRSEEAALFGHADNEGASRSLVRLRLDRWDEGKLKKWETLDKIRHPEVSMPVDAGLYSGYGPITLPKGEKTPQLKANAAIQAGEYAELRLAYLENHGALLEQALWLMDRYGVLGGRSRNGWGSFSLIPENNALLTGTLPLRNWNECLDRDWPHAIGKDEEAALIWQTAPQTDWKKVMKSLAKLKIDLRTKFSFTTGKNAPR